jgi:hypothetical protein
MHEDDTVEIPLARPDAVALALTTVPSADDRPTSLEDYRGRKAAHRLARQRAPWQITGAALAWVGVGVILLVVGLAQPSGVALPDGLSTGMLGREFLALTSHAQGSALWILGGVALAIVGALLGIGLGWTRFVLLAMGAGAVLVLALSARWEALPAMLLVAVGVVLSMMPRAERYLTA